MRPAMIIGVMPLNDTIRILQYGFDRDLSIGTFIQVMPDKTIDLNGIGTLALIQRDLPISLSKNKKDDEYYCKVTKTYFGKID